MIWQNAFSPPSTGGSGWRGKFGLLAKPSILYAQQYLYQNNHLPNLQKKVLIILIGSNNRMINLRIEFCLSGRIRLPALKMNQDAIYLLRRIIMFAWLYLFVFMH